MTHDVYNAFMCIDCMHVYRMHTCVDMMYACVKDVNSS